MAKALTAEDMTRLAKRDEARLRHWYWRAAESTLRFVLSALWRMTHPTDREGLRYVFRAMDEARRKAAID